MSAAPLSENTQLALDFESPASDASAALTPQAFLALADDWVRVGWIRPLDRAVAALVFEQVPSVSPLALLAMILASYQAGQGYICLDLAACLADATILPGSAEGMRGLGGQNGGAKADAPPAMMPGDLLRGVSLANWQDALLACTDAVQSYGISSDAGDVAARPFVLAQGRVYLRRYWQQEQLIVAALQARLLPDERVDGHPEHQDMSTIRAYLDALFPVDAGSSPDWQGPDWQKIACAVAIRQRFALITGGPGTGKTTTVVKFLLLVQMRALAAGLPPWRIRLCAPTGKAAARLHQSIQAQIDGLTAPFAERFPDLRSSLPDAVHTVHRLIGIRPNQSQPVHRPDNPLPANVVVVDESSMIGIELMSKLLAALGDETQLVLLGDKDQLASVEPGAVLGELSTAIDRQGYNQATRDWIARTTGQMLPAADEAKPGTDNALAQTAVQLQHSYRFDAASGIGALARCVNAGDLSGALSILRPEREMTQEHAEVRLLVDDRQHQPLRDLVQAAFASWLLALREPMTAADQNARALAIFAAHRRAQILCALRHGPYGVTGLNRWIEDMLRRSGTLPARMAGVSTGEWYVGRPVMVTRNDAALGLANGEIGITLPYIDPKTPDSPPVLRVAFEQDLADANADDSRRVRWIAPGRLTDCETAFALTVHKAQGSEFEHSILVLPATPNPVLTRELIYTAITRARRQFTLVTAATDAELKVLRQGIGRRMQRSSLLGVKLAQTNQGLGS